MADLEGDLGGGEEYAFVQEDVSAIIKEVRRASSLRLTSMRSHESSTGTRK